MSDLSKRVKLDDLKELKTLLDNDAKISELADLAIDHWSSKKKKTWNKRKASNQDVEAGIRRLLSSGLIDAAKLTAGIASGNPVPVIEAGIQAFQLACNVGRSDHLEADGMFGSITAKAFRIFRGCNPREGRSATLADNAKAKVFNERFGSESRIAAVFCHVEDSFYNSFGLNQDKAEDLVVDAWHLWIPHLDLKVILTGEDDANVVVRAGHLDGSAGEMLGLSHQGGPTFLQTTQLEVLIDEDETFSNEKLLGTLTHELGHTLGLDDQPKQGVLMSQYLDLNITEPQQPDIDRVRAIWGMS